MLEQHRTRSHHTSPNPLNPTTISPKPPTLTPFPLIHPPHHHQRTAAAAATTISTTTMAHHTTQRRILASSSDSKTPIDPTHKKHPTAPPSPNPDPTKHFSALNTNQKVRTSLKETRVDTHLQAKAMSLSTIANSSKSLKPNSRHFTKTAPDVKIQNKSAAAAADPSKEKLKRTSKAQDIKEREKKECHEVYDIKRLSSGAIVKIKKMNKSFEELDIKRPSVSLGRRRSFCGSQIELADFFSSNGARIVSVDMPPFMQIHAVDCARKAHDSLEKFTSKALACTLKKEFDGVYGPAWHCIVGTSFGSFVTHSVGGFLYFSMDQKLYILLFKTTVQRAD